MFKLTGTLEVVKVAKSLSDLEGFRVAAKKSGVDLEAAAKQHGLTIQASSDKVLFFRAKMLGYDLPNGNGDAIPRIYASTFGPSFIGQPLDVNHETDPEHIIGKILATFHVEVPINASEGEERIIGKNAIADMDDATSELQVEGICMIDRTTALGNDIAAKLISGVLNSVSQEASTEYAECSVCGHRVNSPLEPICAHMDNGSMMVQSYQVEGKKHKVLAYKKHHNPVGTGLGVVTVPAYDKAKVSDIVAEKDLVKGEGVKAQVEVKAAVKADGCGADLGEGMKCGELTEGGTPYCRGCFDKKYPMKEKTPETAEELLNKPMNPEVKDIKAAGARYWTVLEEGVHPDKVQHGRFYLEDGAWELKSELEKENPDKKFRVTMFRDWDQGNFKASASFKENDVLLRDGKPFAHVYNVSPNWVALKMENGEVEKWLAGDLAEEIGAGTITVEPYQPAVKASEDGKSLMQRAEEAIENKDDIAYDIALENGQMFDNVKHMKWFKKAVAEALNDDDHSSSGPADMSPASLAKPIADLLALTKGYANVNALLAKVNHGLEKSGVSLVAGKLHGGKDAVLRLAEVASLAGRDYKATVDAFWMHAAEIDPVVKAVMHAKSKGRQEKVMALAAKLSPEAKAISPDCLVPVTHLMKQDKEAKALLHALARACKLRAFLTVAAPSEFPAEYHAALSALREAVKAEKVEGIKAHLKVLSSVESKMTKVNPLAFGVSGPLEPTLLKAGFVKESESFDNSEDKAEKLLAYLAKEKVIPPQEFYIPVGFSGYTLLCYADGRVERKAGPKLSVSGIKVEFDGQTYEAWEAPDGVIEFGEEGKSIEKDGTVKSEDGSAIGKGKVIRGKMVKAARIEDMSEDQKGLLRKAWEDAKKKVQEHSADPEVLKLIDSEIEKLVKESAPVTAEQKVKADVEDGESLMCHNCGDDFFPGKKGGAHDHGNEVCDECWHTLYDEKNSGNKVEAKTPPHVSEKTMHKLKKEYPGKEGKKKAYATAWSIEKKLKNKKKSK